MLMLGDSSTQETVEELSLMLNGKTAYYGDFNGRDQHRNQLIEIPRLNSTLRYRWFGHKEITMNFGGIKSMLEPSMQSELYCLFGFQEYQNCRFPDVIVVQSSHHDIYNGLVNSAYSENVHLLMALLQKAQKLGSKVYWKGSGTFSGRSPLIDSLNEYTALVAKSFGVQYINMTSAFRQAESFMNVSNYYHTYPHVGLNGHKFEMAFSNFLTQYFLRNICENVI